MVSRALTVYSTSVGVLIAVVVVGFFFVLNSLKSLAQEFFFVPFTILVVESSFEHKEIAQRNRYSYVCTMQ